MPGIHDVGGRCRCRCRCRCLCRQVGRAPPPDVVPWVWSLLHSKMRRHEHDLRVGDIALQRHKTESNDNFTDGAQSCLENYDFTKDELYCRIFVDADTKPHALDDSILEFLRTRSSDARVGMICGAICTNVMILSSYRNHASRKSRAKVKNTSVEFCEFPYYLDISPARDIARSRYVGEITALLGHFRKLGWHAVATCDFEEELVSAPR